MPDLSGRLAFGILGAQQQNCAPFTWPKDRALKMSLSRRMVNKSPCVGAMRQPSQGADGIDSNNCTGFLNSCEKLAFAASKVVPLGRSEIVPSPIQILVFHP